jgi:hypothetical protein
VLPLSGSGPGSDRNDGSECRAEHRPASSCHLSVSSLGLPSRMNCKASLNSVWAGQPSSANVPGCSMRIDGAVIDRASVTTSDQSLRRVALRRWYSAHRRRAVTRAHGDYLQYRAGARVTFLKPGPIVTTGDNQEGLTCRLLGYASSDEGSMTNCGTSTPAVSIFWPKVECLGFCH